MRRLLVLTAAAALLLVAFFSRPAITQELYQDCADGPPREIDFPGAASTCKNKLRLEPWLGMPDVVFTLTGRCILSVTLCRAERKCYKSEIREQKGNWCADYAALGDRMTNRTICCDPKCEPATPWFDGLSPNPKCKDRQAPELTNDGDGWVSLRMCGWSVFAHNLKTTDSLFVDAYKAALRDYVRKTVGPTVCCDSFKASARPGSSCDPRFDLDCDGTLNTTDRADDLYPPSESTEDDIFPHVSTFAIAPGLSFKDTDPLPSWFQPGDKGFMPPANLCDCKWELRKGTRTCSSDGKRPHVYQATWRCPSTGNERFTRKEAAASEPCGPESKTTSFFRSPSSCEEPSLQFTSTFRWPI